MPLSKFIKASGAVSYQSAESAANDCRESRAIRGVCVIDGMCKKPLSLELMAPQDPTRPNKVSEHVHREGPAAEPEHENLVTGVIDSTEFSIQLLGV